MTTPTKPLSYAALAGKTVASKHAETKKLEPQSVQPVPGTKNAWAKPEVQFGQTKADPTIITRVASAPATEKSQIPKNAQVHSTPGSAYQHNPYQHQAPYLPQNSPYQGNPQQLVDKEGKPKVDKNYFNYPQQQYGQEFYPQYQQYNPQFYNAQQYTQTKPVTPSWTPAKTSVKIVLKDPTSKDEIILPAKPKVDSPMKEDPKTLQTPKKAIVLKHPITGVEIVPPVKVKLSQPVFETATVETATPSPAKFERGQSPKRAPVEPVKIEAVEATVKYPVKDKDLSTQADTVAVKVAEAVASPTVRQVEPSESIKRPVSPLKTVKHAPVDINVSTIDPPAVEKFHRAASPAKMVHSPSQQPELEEGELVEKKPDVIRADARLLTPSEFSKIKYPAGVAAPKLTNGVLKYSRDFFHMIMERVKSQPQGFPTLASVYGENYRDGGSGRSVNMSRQNSSHGRGRGSKRGDRDNRGSSQMMSRQSSSNRGALKGKRAPPPALPALVKGESAWDAKKLNLNEDEKVLKLTKGTLNKLSLDNFDKLSDKILAMEITNENILQGLMMQICAKAVDEKNFCAMYARLCKKIIDFLPLTQPWVNPDKNNIAKNVFRQLLLKRCQQEFQKDQTWAADDLIAQAQRSAMRKNIENLSAEEKLEFAEEDYKRKQIKQRSLGNIRFVGELFLQSIISRNIIHSCVQHLLKATEVPEEEDCESLCNLMVSIGKRLDTAQDQNFMIAYFQKIKELSENEVLSSRIRFMLLDLIDLRKDRWVGATQNAAKSLAQVQKEIEQEERKKADLKRGAFRNQRDERRNVGRDNQRNERPTFGGDVRVVRKSDDQDGWTSVSKPTGETASVRSGWGSVKKSVKEEKPEKSKSINAFAALQNENSSASLIEHVEVIEKSQIVVLDEAFKNYKESLSLQELLDDIKIVDEVPVLLKLVSNLVQLLIDTNGQVSLKISSVLERLFFQEESLYDCQIFIDGLKSFLEGFEEDLYDFPNAFTNISSVLKVALENQYLTFSNILEITEPLVKYGGKILARPKFFSDLFKTYDGDDKLLKFLIDNEVDVKLFFPETEDKSTLQPLIQKWIDSKKWLRPVKTMDDIVNMVLIAADPNDPRNGIATSFQWFQADSEILERDDFTQLLSRTTITELLKPCFSNDKPVEKSRELYLELKERLNTLKVFLELCEPLVVLKETERALEHGKVFMEDLFRLYYEVEMVSKEQFGEFKKKAKKDSVKVLSGWFKYIESE